MILSMTGYGKASTTYKDKKIYAEIKSLNSKAMDLSVRMAPAYREEMDVRTMIGERLLRERWSSTCGWNAMRQSRRPP